MENVYLEKIAGWADKMNSTEAAGGNRALSSRTHIPANGTPGRKLGAPTNAAMLAGLGSSSKMHAVNTGDKVKKTGLSGLLAGKGNKMQDAGKTRMTGDTLAASTIQDRLAANKKGAANAAMMAKAHEANKAAMGARSAPTGAKGLVHKALGMAKRNPLAAGAIGLGAAAVGASAMSGKKNDNQQGYYQ
jgi:hypothetical protein